MTINQIPPPPPSLDSDETPVQKVARSAAEQNSMVPQGWSPTVNAPIPVVRCTATKRDGTQCMKWSVRGTNVCTKHGAQLPQVQKAAADRVAMARLQLFGATPDAFDVIEGLLQSPTEMIRLKAATEILDRAGLKAGQEVNVTVEHVGSPMDDILAQLEVFTESGNTDEDIVDAEVEEPDEESDTDI